MAGIRTLFMGATTNYTLAADILAPDQRIALSRGGSLNLGVTKVEGIGGVTGRINIPNSRFYLPFYLDAGGGAVPFTWQVYAGAAYKEVTWLDVQWDIAIWHSTVAARPRDRKLNLGGAVFAANIRF